MTTTRFLDATPMRLIVTLVAFLLASAGGSARAQSDRVLGREDIRLLGAGLRVTPATQTVPKDIATIVSTFLQAPTLPDQPLPPFAPDAIVKGFLRGPGFAKPVEISTRPNTPFNLPPFSVAGTYSLDTIRLESGGEVLLYGSPESVTIEVIEKLLVTQVTARPLTAAEIREKGIVFDKTSFQAYNFTASFAVGASNPVPISFPVVLPNREDAKDITIDQIGLSPADVPKLPRLETIIPDTLRVQTQIPNLQVVGFTLQIPALRGKSLAVPPIPGIIVIPGDIGFLNQFFNVTLLVGNVAPQGSNLVVSELRAEILLPPGRDGVANSGDDPLRMAQVATGESARVQLVVQAGADGAVGTGDDIATLGPGETGRAEYLVEGRREGTHVIEMQMTGTLGGLPVGPVEITGRAAGSVLVRNPTFTLTFTHPDLVNAGEPYTLDVTITNSSESPANFVSLNLYPNNVAGATVVGDPSRQVEFIAGGDSATVSFDMIAQVTGPIYAAALDSDENVNGRFSLKTSVGELGIPLSPDSLVLPKETRSLPADLRNAALGLLGKAWAVATAPAAALPPGVTRFSKQIVYDRAIELAEAGFRYTLGEPLPDSVAQLLFDYAGNNVTRIPERATSVADRGYREADARGFDDLRRASIRGDVLAAAVGRILGEQVALAGATVFHQQLAEQTTWRPAHVSVLLAGNGAAAPFAMTVTDVQGRRLGGVDANGKVAKQIPFADLVPLGHGGSAIGQLALLASPQPGELVVRLTPVAGVPAGAPYTIGVVIPDGAGGLRRLVFALSGGQLPNPVHTPSSGITLTFEFADGASSPVDPTAEAAVADPSPRLVAATQVVEGDLLCGVAPAGRVIALLFSEEITRASAQDALDKADITHYDVEANQVVDVALQPGRRIVYIALRDPFGPYIPRTISVSGIEDRAGQVMAPTTLPMVSTINRMGAVVSGRVMRADGTAAGDAEARLFTFVYCPTGLQEFGLSQKTTGADGSFSWDYVPGDPGLIYADRVVGVDPQTGDGRGVNFQVQRDGQRVEVNVVFLGRGTISGRVVDENGQPLPQTGLRFTSRTDGAQFGATSDETGAFSVSGVPVGNVIIEAVYVERDRTGAQVAFAETTLSEYIPVAGAAILRTVVLVRNTSRPTVTYGALRGTVLRGDGVTPVVDVPVVAYYINMSQPDLRCPEEGLGQLPGECAVATTRTDANGAFAFDRIPAGQFRLETFDQVTIQQGDARAVVATDATSSVTVLLGLGLGTVRGIVLDPQGRPVSNARVGGGLSLSVTNAAGQFTLTDVPIGRREIVAVDDATNTRAIGIADLIRAGDDVNVTIVLPAVASIVGTVKHFEGAPASGVTVYLIDCTPSCVREGRTVRVLGDTTTDANGQYRFGALTLGRYRLSAFTSGFGDGNVTDAVLKFSNQVVRADVTFRGGPTGRIRGRVVRALENGGGDTPLHAAIGVSHDVPDIAGGRVGIGFSRVENYSVTESNLTTGEFSFAGIWPGAFTLNAVGVFSPEPIAVEGAIGLPNETIDVVLRLQATSRVTGRVLLPDGVTAAGAGVQVKLRATPADVLCSETPNGDATCSTQERQGVTEIPAVTDADGRFEFVNVPARRFVLRAIDLAGGRMGELVADVRPGETASVDIRLLAKPTVRVRVFSSNGTTRIGGARVDLDQRYGFDERTDDDLRLRNLTADANGELVVAGASAPIEGEFVVLATNTSGGFSGRATGRVAAADDGKTITLDVFLFDGAGVVTGTVFRADGTTPVPNAEVTVSNQAGALAFALTDASGVYRVESIPLGPVFVDSFEAATSRIGAAQGSIDLAGREIDLPVTQLGIGLVRGTVFEGGSLVPVVGARADLAARPAAGRALVQLTSFTDVDGRFYFPGIPVSAFQIDIYKSFSTPPLGNVHARTLIDDTLTREGQIVDLPVILNVRRPQFGRVEGTVFNATGGPSPFARVTLTGSAITLSGTVETTADADGRYAFDPVVIGRVSVAAEPQVGGFERGTGIGELAFEGDTIRVDMVLRGTSTVTGQVFQSDGVTPAPFVTLFLEGQPTSGCEAVIPPPCAAGDDGEPDPVCRARIRRRGCHAAADASGRFTLSNITAQTFTVTADGPITGQRAVVSGTLVPPTASVRLVLSPVSRVTGRVLVSGNIPKSGIVADLLIPGGSPALDTHVFVATDDTGVFAFDAVPPGGPYTLAIADPLGDGVALRTVAAISASVDLGDILLDETAPTVTSTTPLGGAAGVPFDSSVSITFSEALARGTVVPANVILSSPTAAVTGLLSVESGDSAVTFRPLQALAENTRYTLLVKDITDRYGKVMRPFTMTFTTRDVTAPSILQLTPAIGASGVPVTTTVRVQYAEPIDPSAFVGAPITLMRGTDALAGRTDVAFGNTVIVFTPTFPLADEAAYTLRVAAATDLSGNVGAPTLAAFSTTDRTPPQVTSLTVPNSGRVIEHTTIDVAAQTGTAFDVAFVDFYVNGVLTATDRLAPFVFTFLAVPSAGAPGAQVAITALATDTSGNRGVQPASITLTVVADAPPAITITSPAPGTSARNGERIELALTSSDDVGLTQVAYRAETGRPQDAGTVVIAPSSTTRTQTFGFNMPADALPGSIVRVTATVRDTRGQATSADTAITVLDAVNPTVSITGTTTGARVEPGTRVQVIVAASDLGGIRSVSFTAGGSATASETRTIAPALNDVAVAFGVDVPAGAQAGQTITLSAAAVDASGNTATAATLVLAIADRNPPTLTLATASGRLEAVPGSDLTIIANADDEVGVARISVSGTGAFAFSNAKSFSPATGSASASFIVTVPVTAVPGATVAVTGRAVDIFGNASDPTTLLLTVRSVSDVSVSSALVIAGETTDVAVTLSAPAPSGGLALAFESRTPTIAGVAPSITIPAGESSGAVRVFGISGGTTPIDVRIQGILRATFTATVRGGIVRGTIAGATGPVSGANVSIRTTGAPVSTTTDADGRYFIEGFNASAGQPIGVKVSDPATGQIGFAQGTFAATNGSATIDVMLIEAGRISGAVVRPDGVTAVGAGAKVEIFESANRALLALTFTDEAGQYDFPLVTLGTYTLEATDVQGNRGRSSVLIDVSGEEADVPIQYLGRGSVAGTVFASNGSTPVPNAQVTVRGESVFGSSAVLTKAAGTDGAFRFDNIFVGTVTVQAVDPATDTAGSGLAAIAADGEVVTRNVTLSAWTHLEGTVVRADGTTAVPAARVWISMPLSGYFTATADVDGRFRFLYLPLGAFTLGAQDAAGTGSVGQVTGTLTTPGGTVTRDITLLAQGSLVVTVRDGSGALVEGANVFVSVQNGQLSQSRSVKTGGDGLAIIQDLIVGTYTVHATKGPLQSLQQTGSILAATTSEASLQLQATGSIVGTVFLPDGQTPATNVQVSQYSALWGGLQGIPVDANGVFRIDGQQVRTYPYTIHAFDAAGRLRGRSNPTVLDTPGGEVRADITLVGTGIVRGQLLNPDASPAGNQAVQVRALDPVFGGFHTAVTNANGQFVMTDVVAGAFVLTAVDAARGLAADGAGTIPALGGDITVNLQFVSNTITSFPVARRDANAVQYDIRADASVLPTTVQTPFYPYSGGGAFLLDLVVDGTTTRFGGATFVTAEDGGREIAARQTIAGLQVTRKIAVPKAYFGRYIESLTNTTAAPITVDLRVVSLMNGLVMGPTSSGDTVFDVASPSNPDRWAIVRAGTSDGDVFDPQVPGNWSTAFNIDGVDAPARASVLSASSGTLTYGWRVTVAPGETVSLMHFTAPQYNLAAATASAERLAQMPPEALTGLSAAEIAAIRNWVIPPTGISALEPLPAFGGTVTGRVLEHDGVTASPTVTESGFQLLDHVRFRSSVVFYGRTYVTRPPTSAGVFTFASALSDTAASVAVPLAPFTLSAVHPWSQVISPGVTGVFGPGEVLSANDIVFSNTGIITGTLRRHTGAAVTTPGALVRLASTGTPFFDIGNLPLSPSGAFTLYGVPGQAATLFASVPVAGAPGYVSTGLSVTVAMSATVGQVVTRDVAIGPTGSVAGTVRNTPGAAVANQRVTLSVTEQFQVVFTRTAFTSTGGAFAFADVPVGTYVLDTTDPATGVRTSFTVAVLADQVTVQDLQFLAVSRVTGVVRRPSGSPVTGVTVELIQGPVNAPTFLRSDAVDAAGVFEFPNIVAGAYVLRVADPASGLVVQQPVTVITGQATTTQDVVLETVGTLVVTVRANDATQTLVGGAQVFSCVIPTGSNFCFPAFRGTTATSGGSIGQFAITDAPIGRNRVRVQHPRGYGNEAEVLADVVSSTVPGAADVVLSATGTVRVTVRNADGQLVAGAGVDVRYGPNLSYGTGGASSGQNPGVFTTDGIHGSFRVSVSPPSGTVGISTQVTGKMAIEGATIDVPVTLPRPVTLTGRVVGPDGQAVPFASLDFVSGEAFAQYPSVSATGAYSVVVPADVPILVSAYDYTQPPRAGVREITLPGTSATATLDIVLDGAYLPKTLTDGNGYGFTVRRQGNVNENPFENGIFSKYNFYAKYPNGVQFVAFSNGAAIERDGAQLLIRVRQGFQDGLFMSRRVHVPPSGYFIRYIDTIENRGTAPIEVSPILGGWNIQAFPTNATSDGDTTVTPADQWVVGGSANPRVSHVFAGAGAAVPSTAGLDGGNNLVYTWDSVTLQPGQRIALLHFGGQHRDQAAAEGAARRLVQLPPEAIEGIDPLDRNAIINFAVSDTSALATLDVTVSGVVTFDSVQVVPNAQVTLTASNPFVNAPKTTTADAAGAYSLTYPVADAFTLTAFDPATATTSPPVSGTRAPGQSAVTANISLAGAGSNIVQGTVVREGQPVAGATVRLRRAYPAVDRSTTTSASGSFVFHGVDEGWWSIEAASAFGATPITYFYVSGQGATIQQDVHYLTRGGTLTVDVLAADGVTHLSDVEVDVYDRGTGQLIAALGAANVTDPDPQYRFTSLLHSSAGLRVVAFHWARPDVRHEAMSGFPAEGTGQVVSLSLTLPLGVLSGTFRQADGTTPVAFGSVTAAQEGPGGALVRIAVASDADGRFRMSGLVPGTVWLHGADEGGLLTVDAQATMPALPSNGEATLVLPPSGRIAGVVRLADATPVVGAYVAIASNGGPLDAVIYVASASDGSYAFERVPLGAFTVQACDYSVETVCAGASGLAAIAGATVAADITFAARSPVDVLVSADQQPLANTPVYLYSGQMGPGDPAYAFRYTDAAGTATFQDVQRGPLVAAFTDFGSTSGIDIALLGSTPLVVPLSAQGSATWNGSTSVTEHTGVVTQIDCAARLRSDSEGPAGGAPFDRALRLLVNGSAIDCLPVRLGSPSDGGTTRLDYGPWMTGGLLVSRHLVHASQASAIGYLERFQNTTAAAITIDVDIATRFDDRLLTLTAPSSVGNRYAVVSAPDRAIFGHVFAGSDVGLLVPSVVRMQAPGGHSTVRFRLTIPANDYRVLAHFAFTRPAGDGAATQADAAADALSTGTDTSVLALFQVDPAKVVNVRVP